MDTSFFYPKKYVPLYFPSPLEYHSGFLCCRSYMCATLGFPHCMFTINSQHFLMSPIEVHVMMGCLVRHLLASPCCAFVHPTVSSPFHIGSLQLQAELWKWRLKFHLNPGEKTRAEWIKWEPWCWQLEPRLGLYWIISRSLCHCSSDSPWFFMHLELDSNQGRGERARVFCFLMMETRACMLSLVPFGQVGWLQWQKSDYATRNRKQSIL